MMTKSYQVARIAGIDISLHWTFLLFLLWVFVSGILRGFAVVDAVIGLVFVMAAFTCVLLHELGHATAARWFGIPTHGITLLPIGGVAQLDRIPRHPWQELVIAIAGPAVNVVIAIALLPFVLMDSGDLPGGSGALWSGSLTARLLVINVGLVLFNLIPAFPMDGGRMLRAFIASLIDNYEFATLIAARCGQAIAVVLGIAGLYLNPMLVLVAAFVIMAAQSELNEVRHARHRAEPIVAELVYPAEWPSQSLERHGVVGGKYRRGLSSSEPGIGFPIISVEFFDSDPSSLSGR
jgi:Zn-dependent protease